MGTLDIGFAAMTFAGLLIALGQTYLGGLTLFVFGFIGVLFMAFKEEAPQ